MSFHRPALLIIVTRGLIFPVFLGFVLLASGLSSSPIPVRSADPDNLAATFPQLAHNLAPQADFQSTTRSIDGATISGVIAAASPTDAVDPVASAATSEFFFPSRYADPFLVIGNGLKVSVQAIGADRGEASSHDGHLVYRDAFSHTDSWHVVGSGGSEEFLLLKDANAPTHFDYRIQTGVGNSLIKGDGGTIRIVGSSGPGLEIAAPWVVEVGGQPRTDVARWELGVVAADGSQLLTLRLTATGLSYPLVVDPSWTLTGSMTAAREYHTATLLPNGKVLVAGGCCDSNNHFLSSSELYDPTSRTWSLTGGMSSPREGHTATLLANGKVLVVGGDNGGGPVSSAEIFDPTTGSWTATGGMGTARAAQTATLLKNGTVLVEGGTGSTFPTSTEVFNPLTGTWRPTGNLKVAREGATATLMSSGQVLVAGGHTNSGGALSSAELFNPTNGTWTLTGSMNAARSSHTATLLASGKVLVAAGDGSAGSLTSSELFDPTSGTWTLTGSMNAARDSQTATRLESGKVLIVGGYGSHAAPLSLAELYDPSTGTYLPTGSMITERYAHSATLLSNGKVLVAGGIDGNLNLLGTAELYDPTFVGGGTWVPTGSLNASRTGQTMTRLSNGKVLVTGGYSSTGIPCCMNSAEIYDPEDGVWALTGSMNTGRVNHTATNLPGGTVLIAGGRNKSTTVGSSEIYNPTSGTWSLTGTLSVARQNHTATLLKNGKVLVVGGGTGTGVALSSLNSAELFNPTTGTWSPIGSLNAARMFHTATLLQNGKVLVVGGSNASGTLNSAELYDPTTGTWSPTGNLNVARASHTATLLPNGTVLVAGGGYSSAELYNPTTGIWSLTGSMTIARSGDTATLLSNGKVLVAGGGITNTGEANTSEVFDPPTNTWTRSNSNMLQPRQGHTAVLLQSGKVLVAGGSDSSADGTSAELYNP